ncbi:MAG: hypothetical protein AMK73_09680, partial [Planctomycetes bacterium SM23_32]
MLICCVLVPAAAGLAHRGTREPLAGDADAPPLRPPVYTAVVNQIPDMLQTDPHARLPDGGKAYCGPVAVSNSLVWLDAVGFPDMVPDVRSPSAAQADLARLLGSAGYMNTDPTAGTGPAGVLLGVQRYVRERLYQYERLEYQGWRPHPAEFRTGVAVPELSFMQEGILGAGAVWVNIGWYTYDRRRDEYRRVGGHWVTMVGYGEDEEGRPHPHIIIVHDPAPRAGVHPAHEYVLLRQIQSGT